MANGKLKFGIIGCGAIHGTHADALGGIEGAEVAGFYDIVQEKSCTAADKYGALAAKNLEELFDHVDAVCLCVPSGDHANVGIEAAKAGKHVVCEKPIDVTLRAAKSLIEACDKAGVTLTVISQHRFAKDIRQVREAAQSGALGPLIAGDMYNKWFRTQAYYDSGDWRGTWKLDGGGCLMNQGVHYVDMLQWIMGGVKAVQAQTRTVSHERIEVEDIANAMLEFENGAVGVIQASTAYYPGLAERLEIHGKWGTAIIEGDRLKVWEVDEKAAEEGLYGRGIQKQPTPNVHTHGDKTDGTGAADPSAIWTEQHRRQLDDFTQAVLNKRQPFITGPQALEPLKVILAVYESARRNGERVELARLA
ncbi:MAG: Gfo/Idh/MocA family protein [Fimbriimonadales bacterium]